MGDLAIKTIALLISTAAGVAPFPVAEHQGNSQGRISLPTAGSTQALEQVRYSQRILYGEQQSGGTSVGDFASQVQVSGLAVTDVNLGDPEVEWAKAYGHAGTETAECAAPTEDGGIVIAGTTHNTEGGIPAVLLMKVDAEGDSVWTSTVTLPGQSPAPRSVLQTSDGGYVVCGLIEDLTTEDGNSFILRTDEFGDSIWTNSFGGPEHDELYSVLEPPGGGYYLSGTTFSYGSGNADGWLLKVDSTGVLHPAGEAGPDSIRTWSRYLGGSETDGIMSAALTPDGITLAGETTSLSENEYPDAWVVRVRSDGTIQQSTVISEPEVEAFTAISPTPDGGFICAGYTYYVTTRRIGFMLAKIDAAGEEEWRNYIFGHVTEISLARTIWPTPDGGYIAAGYTYGPRGGLGWAWAQKTDAAGNSEWRKVLGAGDGDLFHTIVPTEDQGYLIVGTTASHGAGETDVILVKLWGMYADPRLDFNANGRVDFPDFLMFARSFGWSIGYPSYDPTYDFDGNTRVNFADFIVFARAYGKSCKTDVP